MTSTMSSYIDIFAEIHRFMSFVDLASRRYSVRRYTARQIEDEKLKRVLEAGRIAPSACNNQPWEFYVIRQQENINKIAGVYTGSWIKEAPVIIVLCGNHNKSWKRSDGKDHCDIDVAIAADHMTLAATDLGLGTCWICAFDKDLCSRILNLPENLEPIVMLPLGYPADKGDSGRHKADRKPLNEIVNWEF